MPPRGGGGHGGHGHSSGGGGGGGGHACLSFVRVILRIRRRALRRRLRAEQSRAVPVAGAAVAVGVASKRPFYIVNEHGDHVLEIHAGLTAPGTHCEVWRRRPDKAMHQLWHIDPATGLIHSMINDYVLECKGIGERFTIGPHIRAPYQNWCIEGRSIRNKMFPTECLEIRRGDFRDGADCILHRYEGKPWQHWRLEYI